MLTKRFQKALQMFCLGKLRHRIKYTWYAVYHKQVMH
jgi:hypothetical protein